VYTKACFSATSAIAAPAGDLSLLKTLVCYPDEQIDKATSKTLANHLWYLSEDLAALSLFDANVEVEIKRLLVAGLKEDGQENPQPRADVDLASKETLAMKTVANFVPSASLWVFAAFQVPTGFLDKDPSE
jgi:hypothetical protein